MESDAQLYINAVYTKGHSMCRHQVNCHSNWYAAWIHFMWLFSLHLFFFTFEPRFNLWSCCLWMSWCGGHSFFCYQIVHNNLSQLKVTDTFKLWLLHRPIQCNAQISLIAQFDHTRKGSHRHVFNVFTFVCWRWVVESLSCHLKLIRGFMLWPIFQTFE